MRQQLKAHPMRRRALAQFTSAAFIGVLGRQRIAVSMDRKGCWRDNVFVERLWMSVKYE
jgi:putative transposase